MSSESQIDEEKSKGQDSREQLDSAEGPENMSNSNVDVKVDNLSKEGSMDAQDKILEEAKELASKTDVIDDVQMLNEKIKRLEVTLEGMGHLAELKRRFNPDDQYNSDSDTTDEEEDVMARLPKDGKFEEEEEEDYIGLSDQQRDLDDDSLE